MTTDEDAKVGVRKRSRREALGISRKEFAAALSISVAQLSRYELGSNRVPADRIFHLGNLLSSAEGIELNTAFARVGHDARRAAIAALVTAIANDRERK